MKLNKLTLKDKSLFNRFLKLTPHKLSVYAFENIYIWKGIFDIYWAVIEDNLCIFFKDKMGCFLYLPPLGKKVRPEVIAEVFQIMDKFNAHKEISRIENAEEKNRRIYQDLGYTLQDKFGDYLCQCTDLAGLKGNRFKSQRASFNYFIKHYKFKYQPFNLRYRDGCLKLYDRWVQNRQAYDQDPVYQGMLGDTRVCLKTLLDNYSDLDCMGKVVEIDNQIKAFSFGFKLNKDTFCVLYEITDLEIKGLAQFIFRQFCSELEDYRFINIMDDSGLENLKRLKLSYHPIKLISTYIVTRKIRDTLEAKAGTPLDLKLRVSPKVSLRRKIGNLGDDPCD